MLYWETKIPMRILILEDSPERQRKMRQRLIGHVVEIAETAQAAIDRLRDERWDVLCLDHDLGGQQMVESGPGTGYEVAKWLEGNKDRIPERIVLHSYNEPGRANMLACLPGAVEMPGWWIE
jgi:CheY-like chemotaxis protein